MMKKLLFLLAVLPVFSMNAQTLTNLVFESTITPTTTSVDLTFDFAGVSVGDTFEWQLFLALPDGSPDWSSGRNIAYSTGVIPNVTGSGTQTVSLGTYNTPLEGEVFTWTGKITLASDGSDTGYNNTGNLVTISSTAGINDVNGTSIQVYPNPTSDKLFIHYLLEVNKIGIIDISGRMVLEFNNVKNLKSIDVSNLTKGIYFLTTDLGGQLKFLKK